MSIGNFLANTFIKKEKLNEMVDGINNNEVNININTPPGIVQWYASNSEPQGWLLCNGQAISRSTYSDLFSIIGTTYGIGDGSTTFNVPDMRGRFIRGFDDGLGLDPGRAFGTTQDDSFQDHYHNYPIIAGTTPSTGTRYMDTTINYARPDAFSGYFDSSSVGGDETRPKNIALNAIIKY